MNKYEIAVSKRVFANISVEAETATDAGLIAQAMYSDGKIPASSFSHFDPGEQAADFAVDWAEPA